ACFYASVETRERRRLRSVRSRDRTPLAPLACDSARSRDARARPSTVDRKSRPPPRSHQATRVLPPRSSPPHAQPRDRRLHRAKAQRARADRRSARSLANPCVRCALARRAPTESQLRSEIFQAAHVVLLRAARALLHRSRARATSADSVRTAERTFLQRRDAQDAVLRNEASAQAGRELPDPSALDRATLARARWLLPQDPRRGDRCQQHLPNCCRTRRRSRRARLPIAAGSGSPPESRTRSAPVGSCSSRVPTAGPSSSAKPGTPARLPLRRGRAPSAASAA